MLKPGRFNNKQINQNQLLYSIHPAEYQRERERDSLCLCERERERERETLCAYVCEREREIWMRRDSLEALHPSKTTAQANRLVF